MIKKKDFEEWKTHPVSEWFFKEIEQSRDAVEEYSNGVLWNNDKIWFDGRAEMMRNAMRAQHEVYQTILDMQPEEDDEEQERD